MALAWRALLVWLLLAWAADGKTFCLFLWVPNDSTHWANNKMAAVRCEADMAPFYDGFVKHDQFDERGVVRKEIDVDDRSGATLVCFMLSTDENGKRGPACFSDLQGLSKTCSISFVKGRCSGEKKQHKKMEDKMEKDRAVKENDKKEDKEKEDEDEDTSQKKKKWRILKGSKKEREDKTTSRKARKERRAQEKEDEKERKAQKKKRKAQEKDAKKKRNAKKMEGDEMAKMYTTILEGQRRKSGRRKKLGEEKARHLWQKG